MRQMHVCCCSQQTAVQVVPALQDSARPANQTRHRYLAHAAAAAAAVHPMQWCHPEAHLPTGAAAMATPLSTAACAAPMRQPHLTQTIAAAEWTTWNQTHCCDTMRPPCHEVLLLRQSLHDQRRRSVRTTRHGTALLPGAVPDWMVVAPLRHISPPQNRAECRCGRCCSRRLERTKKHPLPRAPLRQNRTQLRHLVWHCTHRASTRRERASASCAVLRIEFKPCSAGSPCYGRTSSSRATGSR
jgi:hypothetical protein